MVSQLAVQNPLNNESRINESRGVEMERSECSRLGIQRITQEIRRLNKVEAVNLLLEEIDRSNPSSLEHLASLICNTLSEEKAGDLPLNVRYWIDGLLEETVSDLWSKAHYRGRQASSRIKALSKKLEDKEGSSPTQLPHQLSRELNELNDCFNNLLRILVLSEGGFLYNSPVVKRLMKMLELISMDLCLTDTSRDNQKDSDHGFGSYQESLAWWQDLRKLSETLNSRVGENQPLRTLRLEITSLFDALISLCTVLQQSSLQQECSRSCLQYLSSDGTFVAPLFLMQEVFEALERYFDTLPERIRNGSVCRCAKFISRDGNDHDLVIVRQRVYSKKQAGGSFEFIWKVDATDLTTMATKLLPLGTGDEIILGIIDNNGQFYSLIDQISPSSTSPQSKIVLDWLLAKITLQNIQCSTFDLRYGQHSLDVEVKLIEGRVCLASERDKLEEFLKKITPVLVGDQVKDPSDLTRISGNPVTEGCILALIAAKDSNFAKRLAEFLSNETGRSTVIVCQVGDKQINLVCIKDDTEELEILVSPDDNDILLNIEKTESLEFIKITPEALWLYNPELFSPIDRAALVDYRYYVYNNLRGGQNGGNTEYYVISGIPILAIWAGKELVKVPVSMLELVHYDLKRRGQMKNRSPVFSLNRESLKSLFEACGDVPESVRKKFQREILSQVQDAFRKRGKRDSSVTVILNNTELEVTILPVNPNARKATRTVLMKDDFRKFLQLLRDLGFKPTLTAHGANQFFTLVTSSNDVIGLIDN